MTLSEAIATPLRQRRSSRAAALHRAPLEDLVAELLARLDEQSADHSQHAAAVNQELGRDAVEDQIRHRAFSNLRFSIDHGTRAQQHDAADRLERAVERDEQREEQFLRALLSLFSIHNVDARRLRGLLRDNARAITHGEDVTGIDGIDADDLPLPIPAPLLARQKARA